MSDNKRCDCNDHDAAVCREHPEIAPSYCRVAPAPPSATPPPRTENCPTSKRTGVWDCGEAFTVYGLHHSCKLSDDHEGSHECNCKPSVPPSAPGAREWLGRPENWQRILLALRRLHEHGAPSSNQVNALLAPEFAAFAASREDGRDREWCVALAEIDVAALVSNGKIKVERADNAAAAALQEGM